MTEITPATPVTPENVAEMLTAGDNDYHDGNMWHPSIYAEGNVVHIGITAYADDEEGTKLPEMHFRAAVVEALPPADNLLGTVRRKPNGCVLAVLWPSPPSPDRWMVTDMWGSCGYETDEAVKDWPVVGAVPFSPAAGVPLKAPEDTQTGGASDA